MTETIRRQATGGPWLPDSSFHPFPPPSTTRYDDPWDKAGHEQRSDDAVRVKDNDLDLGLRPHIGCTSLPAPNRDLGTRNLNIAGLAVGWCAAVACLTVGAYILAVGPIEVPSFLMNRAALVGSRNYSWAPMPDPKDPNPYIPDHRVFLMSEASAVVIPLAVQVILTLVFSALNSIHSTTLRWALWHEGRLRYNSNLRLFTSSELSWGNKWPANTVSTLGLVLAHGGAALLTKTMYITGSIEVVGSKVVTDPNVTGERYGIDFDGWGLLGLGVGLFLQAVVSTWCLVGSGSLVATWSTNPLAVACACGTPVRLPDARRATDFVRCTHPSFISPPIRAAAPHTRTLTLFLWAVSLAVAVWAAVLAALAVRRGSATTAYVRDRLAKQFGANESSQQPGVIHTWQLFGEVTVPLAGNPYEDRRGWVGLVIQSGALGLFLLALHCGELIVNLSLDEAVWRRAATVGARPNGSMLAESARHAPSWGLFACQVAVPWVFGVGFAPNIRELFMSLPSFVTLVVLLSGMAGLAECLVRMRPRGTQPATYGDVQALAALADDWSHDRIFWGDKGEYPGAGRRGLRMAGTAGRRLADVREGVLYIGLEPS
ncbi:hypothetical protein OQA88_2568 [Cercophora sp. LCS_1]